jgi:hypothetical protein
MKTRPLACIEPLVAVDPCCGSSVKIDLIRSGYGNGVLFFIARKNGRV